MSLAEASNTKKSEKIKLFLQKNFTKKNNLWRLVFFLFGVVVLLCSALIMELWTINCRKNNYGDGFICIRIQLNSGIAFSGLANLPGLIYFLQALIILILIGIFLFLVKKYYLAFMSLAVCGGTYNLIDRMIPKTLACDPSHVKQYNQVLDYFSFYGKSAIFNFSDVWILTGVIGFCLLVLIFNIINVVKENKQKKQEAKG